MRFKSGVSGAGLQLEMRPVLRAADKIWKQNGQELVITEAAGGDHSAGSLHYYGYAVDMRTRDFMQEDVEEIRHDLALKLGSDYDVIVHSSHMHVEYQKILDGGRYD